MEELQSEDPDGDILTHHWVVDGAANGVSANSIDVVLNVNDTINVTSWTTDSHGLKSSNDTKIVRVNSPPNISSLKLLDVAPGKKFYLGEIVKVGVAASDPDGDPLFYSWYVNGVGAPTVSSNGSWLYHLVTADDLHNSKLPYLNITVVVDDYTASVSNSLNVSLINRPPSGLNIEYYPNKI